LGKRRRKNWQKYGLWTAATLAGLGWQLTTGTVAEADEVAEPAPVAESVVTSPELEPATSSVTSSSEDEIAERPGTTEATWTLAPQALSGDGVILSQPGKRHLRRVKANNPMDDQHQSTTAVVAATPVPEIAEVVKDETPHPQYTNETIDQWMPNKVMQAETLSRLQRAYQDDHKTWASVADITQKDMLRLKDFFVNGDYNSLDQTTYIDGHTPFSIKGIEYAVNLDALGLTGAGMNAFNQTMYGDLVDISALKWLKKLTWLDLQYNRVRDISALAELKNLELLWLTHNQIADFSPLQDLNIKDIMISEQHIWLPKIRVDPHQALWMRTPFKFINGDDLVLYANYEFVKQFVYKHDYDEVGYNFDFYRYDNGFDIYADGNVEFGEDENWGDLKVNNIREQELGNATDLEQGERALPDKYYLIASAFTDMDDYRGKTGDVDGKVNLYLIQPYATAKQAGKITVHYQDEEGKTLEKDLELPDGDVGSAYNTTPLEIKGYTLSKAPENAQGVYAETPIEITYVYWKNATEKPSVTPPVVTPPTVTPPTDGGTAPTTKPMPGQQPDQVDTGSKPDQVKPVPQPVPVSVAGGAADQVDEKTVSQPNSSAKPQHGELPPVMPTTAQSKRNTLLPQTDGQSAYQLLGVIGLLIAFWGLEYRGED